jgi:hypothetical protein
MNSNTILQFKNLKDEIELLITFKKGSKKTGYAPQSMSKLFKSDDPLMMKLDKLTKGLSTHTHKTKYEKRKNNFWFIRNITDIEPICSLDGCTNKCYVVKMDYATGCCLKHVRKACSLERMKKEKETIDENGLSLIDKRVAKTAKTLLEDIDENGKNGFDRKKEIFKKTAYSVNSEGKMLKDIWIEKAMETNIKIGSYETSGIKSLEARLNNIDSDGLNGLERAHKNGACKTRLKRYKNTTMYYQGSHELKFLEKKELEYGSVELLLENVKRGPTFKYFDPTENKERNYFSDFIIDNIVYEIKSTWTWNNRKKGSDIENTNKAKLDAVINNGLKVVLVKDFIEEDYQSSS